MKKVLVSSIYNYPARFVYEQAKTKKFLLHTTKGLVDFECNLLDYPEVAYNGLSWTGKMWVFGLKNTSCDYSTVYEKIDDEHMTTLSVERGGNILEWLHEVRIESLDKDRCRYVDNIKFIAKTGMAEFMTWIFTYIIYRWRQRRQLSYLNNLI